MRRIVGFTFALALLVAGIYVLSLDLFSSHSTNTGRFSWVVFMTWVLSLGRRRSVLALGRFPVS